ncbi:MAG: hypothetical protein N2204_06075, partial [Anaerolineae bacterium]|nr:hypothetical protein [Anaerolineae bacterium]
YWYWLEDVDLSGVTTLHGPVSATRVGPNALHLAGFRGTSSLTPLAVTTSVVIAALATVGLWLGRRWGLTR